MCLWRGREGIPEHCVIGRNFHTGGRDNTGGLGRFSKLGFPPLPGWATPSITCRTRWLTFPNPAQRRNYSLVLSHEEAIIFLALAPSSRECRLTEKKKFGVGKESLKITFTPILQPKWSFKNQVQNLSQLAYYPPPTWNKTQSSYQSLSGLHDLILAASSSSIPLPLHFCTQARGSPAVSGSWHTRSCLRDFVVAVPLPGSSALGVCLVGPFSWLSSQVTSSERFSLAFGLK